MSKSKSPVNKHGQTMRRAHIRSTLFNITFILVNIICCILLLPTLLLPRKSYMKVIKAYYKMITVLETYVLGLRFNVIGAEHIPKDGAYIVAAKHMSTYETFKLHLLFTDPAIILKRELLRIPLWGQFLKKTGVIAIDRSSPTTATESIKIGTLEMKEKGRPIVIFPQGTRVWPHETPKEKRYKSGIYRIQKQTNLPIIPMATNSGCFWPRSGWLKSSGTVTFKILPAINPGQTKDKLMSTLEENIESESNALMDKAKKDSKDKKFNPALFILPILTVLILAAAGTYTYLWFEVADKIKADYITFMANLGRTGSITEPTLSGFPGPIKLSVLQEGFERDELTLDIKVIEAKIWPLPNMPITLKTGPITFGTVRWPDTIRIDSTSATFIPNADKTIDLQSAKIQKAPMQIDISGTIDLNQHPIPRIDTIIAMSGFETLIDELTDKDIIEERMAPFLKFGFTNLQDEDGIVRVPLKQHGQKLYAGPLPIADLPETFFKDEFENSLQKDATAAAPKQSQTPLQGQDQAQRPAAPAASHQTQSPLAPYNLLGPDQ